MKNVQKSNNHLDLLKHFRVLNQSYELIFLDPAARHVWYKQKLEVECRTPNADKYPFKLTHDGRGYVDGLMTTSGVIEVVEQELTHTQIMLELSKANPIGKKTKLNLECSYRESGSSFEEDFWEVSKITEGASRISIKLAFHPERRAKTSYASLIQISTGKTTMCSTQPFASRLNGLPAISFNSSVSKGYKIKINWKW